MVMVMMPTAYLSSSKKGKLGVFADSLFTLSSNRTEKSFYSSSIFFGFAFSRDQTKSAFFLRLSVIALG
jgi:hypothetical protein